MTKKLPIDTKEDLLDLQAKLVSSLSEGEKLLRTLQYMEFARNCMLAGIKSDYPNCSDEELMKRFAARTIGREFTLRQLNWDPEIEGY